VMDAPCHAPAPCKEGGQSEGEEAAV
jgi:hypothetical protein